ncbi:MAG: peptide chain release factor N(5)-glutamine methyltransferase [Dehalococcoidia bacterium]|nr:peptide chain release factor N(5)-glutamine methyltransferase [Dehalococcoidia bacterium]
MLSRTGPGSWRPTSSPDRCLTVWEALRDGAATLAAAHDPEAAPAAERLLMHVLGLSRAGLLTAARTHVSPEQHHAYRALLARRAAGEPVAYLTGRQPFRRLDLVVTPDVLIPRPETELIVDLALETRPEPPLVIDVGTGAGAIALALADEAPGWRIAATDCSLPALRVARHNRERLGLAVDLVLADLLRGVRGPIGLIVANLPYIDTSQWAALPPSVRDWEPRLALDGGPGGLRLIARLVSQAVSRLAPSGTLLCEIAHDQGERAAALAQRAFPTASVDIVRDLAGHDRVLRVRRR